MRANPDDLIAFAAIVEAGGITAATRNTTHSKATLSRALTRLEDQAGAPLFDRLPRGLKLTPLGDTLVRSAQRTVAAAGEADDVLRGAKDDPQGQLNIATSSLLGRQIMGPAIADFARKWPDLRPNLIISHRPVDPVEEDMDIVFRIGRPEQPQLVARRMATLEMRLWTSRERLGDLDPRSFDTVSGLGRVLIQSPMLPTDWLLTNDKTGETHVFDDEPVICVGEPGVAHSVIMAGFGMTMLPTTVANPVRKSDRLALLLPEWRGEDVELYAVMPARRSQIPAVRQFIDYLAEFIKR